MAATSCLAAARAASVVSTIGATTGGGGCLDLVAAFCFGAAASAVAGVVFLALAIVASPVWNGPSSRAATGRPS